VVFAVLQSVKENKLINMPAVYAGMLILTFDEDFRDPLLANNIELKASRRTTPSCTSPKFYRTEFGGGKDWRKIHSRGFGKGATKAV
jgi:hypothetical protein